MRARLKDSAIIHKSDCKWVKHGEVYEAEFSEKRMSPRPVVLIHPTKSGFFCELPYSAVEIIPD